MKWFVEMLQREDGFISFGRVISFVIVCVWLFITVNAFLTGKNFAHYDTLTNFTAFNLACVICGKWVDFKNPFMKG